MSKSTGFGVLFLIVAQIAVTYWAYHNAEIMRQEWLQAIPSSLDAEVELVHTERFWGPVYALVPRHCGDLKTWQEREKQEEHAEKHGGPITLTEPHVGGGKLKLRVSDHHRFVHDANTTSALKAAVADSLGVPPEQVTIHVHTHVQTSRRMEADGVSKEVLRGRTGAEDRRLSSDGLVAIRFAISPPFPDDFFDKLSALKPDTIEANLKEHFGEEYHVQVLSVSAPTLPPTATPTPAPTPSPTAAPTVRPTSPPTAEPTHAPTKAPTAASTHAPTKTTATSPAQAAGTSTKETPTVEPTHAPTKRTASAAKPAPTKRPTAAATQAPTKAKAASPAQAAGTSTKETPNAEPTHAPTRRPRAADTHAPTAAGAPEPTQAVGTSARGTPTAEPTHARRTPPTSAALAQSPTKATAAEPTQAAATPTSVAPTHMPTQRPTLTGSMRPTSQEQHVAKPSAGTTVKPVEHTDMHRESPSPTPVATTATVGAANPSPTASPTAKPTVIPSVSATMRPTAGPTAKPTAAPTVKPTAAPTVKPTTGPTAVPTVEPTFKPTEKPTASPTKEPTAKPTARPTATPTAEPTAKPTAKPTVQPTPRPTPAPTATPPALPLPGPESTESERDTVTFKMTDLVVTATTTMLSTTQPSSTRFSGVYPEPIHANNINDALWNSVTHGQGPQIRLLQQKGRASDAAQKVALPPEEERPIVVQQAPANDGEHPVAFSVGNLFAALIPGFGGGSHKYKLAMSGCERIVLFDQPHVFARYFSMVTFTRLFQSGLPDFRGLREQRRRSFRMLVIGIGITMLLKYTVKIADIISGIVGHQYMQLWNKTRTKFDRIIESLILHSLSIAFSLTMQITLCTCYFTFWRNGHFIISFVPGFGLLIFFGCLVFISLLNILDRCRGLMLRCSNRGLYTFWIMWAIWVFLLTTPMIGYSVFAVQYMVEVHRAGWIGKEGILSPRFVEAAQQALVCCFAYIVIAIADIILIIRIDLEKHAGSSVASATNSVLGPAADRGVRALGF